MAVNQFNMNENGCSLEDCHTNLFALTDLTGIKWRRLSTQTDSCTVDPNDDPVLVSYSKCIQSDMLCVWRRQPRLDKPVYHVLSHPKELWLFWYGEEPANLSSLISSELIESESSCWENGLTYECRTLLFKALHNLIERCLVSHNFIRIGKWFVCPCREKNETRANLSVSFLFFLHGDSTVCASIDVRQHPPLHFLHPSHLTIASQMQGVPVLLAPYGMTGSLTGQLFTESDHRTQKLLKDWKNFYSFPKPENLNLDSGGRGGGGKDLPAAVEVLVAGIKLCYPSSFVLVTGEVVDSLAKHHSHLLQSVSASDSVSDALVASQALSSSSSSSATCSTDADGGFISGNKKTNNCRSDNLLSVKKTLHGQLMIKSWHDSTLTTSGLYLNSRHHHHPTEAGESNNNNSSSSSNDNKEELPSLSSASDSLLLDWNFVEPMQKNSCNCTKSKNLKMKFGLVNKQQPSGGGGVGKVVKGEKNERDRLRLTSSLRGVAPYHRRPLLCHETDLSAMTEMDFHLPQMCSAFKTLSPSAETGWGGGSGGGMAFGRNCGGLSQGMTDSPHSGVPSPLVSSSQTQPNVNQNVVDPTMPTLSPHPLPSTTTNETNRAKECQYLNASADSSTSFSSSSFSSASTSVTASSRGIVDYEGTTNDERQFGTNPTSSVRSVDVTPSSSSAAASATAADDSQNTKQMKREYIRTWKDDEMEKHVKMNYGRRPILPLQFEDEDEEELKTSTFYDHTSDFVLDNRNKRKRTTNDLGDQSSSSSPVDHDKIKLMNFTRPFLVGDISPSSSSFHHHLHHHHHHPDDPYQFTDDFDSNPMKTLHSVRVGSCDDVFPSKPIMFAGGGVNSRQDGMYNRGRDADDADDKISMEFSPSPKAAQATDMMSEDYLRPKIQDLDKLFDTDEECDLNSPPSPNYCDKTNGNHSTTRTSIHKPSNAASRGGMMLQEIGDMFPTPPSTDNPSSEPMHDIDNYQTTISDGLVLTSNDHHHHHYNNSVIIGSHHVNKEEVKHSVAASRIRKEYPFVYKVPVLSVCPTSNVYDPIPLPSNNNCERRLTFEQNDTLTYQPLYRRLQNNIADKLNQTNQMSNGRQQLLKSVPSLFSGNRSIGFSSSSFDFSPAMMMFGPPSAQQRTPMNYELMSPASSLSSSYLNRNLSSIENSQSLIDQQTSSESVNSLTVNVLLMDSVLNLFKDQNFDSCTICVCNTNVDGNDVGLYLPDRRKEEQFRCHCAFSAVVNRRHAIESGLFYEDEVDITGNRHGRLDGRKPGLVALAAASDDSDSASLGKVSTSKAAAVKDGDEITEDLMMLLKEQFSTVQQSCIVLSNHHKSSSSSCSVVDSRLNPEWGSLELHDGQEACYSALEFSRLISSDICSQLQHVNKNIPCLHPWPYSYNLAKISSNSQDIVRLLKSLQPLLQDALQKKRTTRLWESVYTISGPLSWKDFHLMAGRGLEETSEPKPVPRLLVGFDKEWMSLSPHAIRFWDKLMLEPYSQPRDVLYVIVAPENDYVLNQAAIFVKELGVMYEQCRLGRHKPLSEKLRDGVLRIGKTNSALVAGEPTDDWFRAIGNSPMAAKLRLYSQVFRKILASFIEKHLSETCSANEVKPVQYQHFQQQHHTDTSSSNSSSFCAAASTAMTAAGPSDSLFNTSSFFGNDSSSSLETSSFEASSFGQQQLDAEADNSEMSHAGGSSGDGPFVVLYLLEPFTYGQDEVELSRLAMFGLLRCYHDLLQSLPENIQRKIQLQIIPQQMLLDFDHVTGSQFLKSMSFSVYSKCQRVLTPAVSGRALTGFGTAADAERFLQEQKSGASGGGGGGAISSFQLYTPPFVLAPPHPPLAVLPSSESWIEPVEKSGVLLCTYCLSEDQRFLLASCIDGSGELLETSCINIEVRNRMKRNKPMVARSALAKLFDFILGVITQTLQPWRIVIGRFGRLGHGELHGWSLILNRKNLLRCSQQLRRSCQSCNILQTSESPSILSACLISMELHPNIHIMMDSVKREENQSSKCLISTPRDASCTHILVFPMSARSHDPSVNLPENHMEFAEDEDILTGFDMDEIIQDDIDDFFVTMNSPKNPSSAPGSPTMNDGRGNELNRENSFNQAASEQYEMSNLNLLQQPLAMGFYISTAQTGPLPKWFWSSCPEKERQCPVCFKASLHIHCSSVHQNLDDPLHNRPIHNKHSHSLDSNVTTDVLRYVLETYNRLSWLTIDPLTNDRRSCLPAHIVVLMQLYSAINHYV